MDTDTRSSGTKLFYQVKPSGQRRVLKMVPGKSIQTQTVVTSSVHVVRPKRPLTAVPLNHGHSKARVRPPEQLCISPTQSTSPMKTTLPALGTCIIRVPAPVQTSAPRNKRMLVAPVDKSPKIIIRFPTERNDKPNRSLSRSPVAPNPLTPRLEEANAIRSFTKVTNTANANCTANAAPMSEKQTRQLILRLPQRPNSPNKWVIEENGPNSSSSSSQTSGIGSEVMEVGATEKQPECSVLMWDDRVFFRVEKKIKTGGVVDVIDLCGEDEVGEAADTRARGGDEAQTGSRSEEGRGEETRSGPGDHSSSAQPRQRSGQRGRHSQKSSSSAASAEDHRLRQMFGITSEVQVRLPRLVLHDTGRSSASQAPPLDYTQPIEEDFLCDADPHHSQGCPQVEAAPSRVGRTRKRTRCPCCSPAALFRHRAHNRRSKTRGRGQEGGGAETAQAHPKH